MAINKNLIHFNKKEDFEREVANDNILDRSIVFIKDSNEIHTHGTTYGGVTPKDISDLKDLIDTHHKEIQIYCIEPVTVTVDGVDHLCEANKYSTIFVGDLEFTITPTSNKSIKLLSAYPIPLTWYDWLEGVEVFSNIIFDMNAVETYHHWSQGNQGQFHVQFAQYINCIFWSDNSYVSAVNERTNYTIYNSAELPLCYSTIRENTYKAFYFAYGVKTDPNWNNDDYLYSFSLANWATQTWSYYGARTIGIFNSSIKPITLPKDCRGLCFYSPAIENVGVLDAINTTNFGAKKGSWSEAFGYCFSLKNLYIRNLKVSINISWSPINLESITYIINNAANTSAITISVSPYTWNIIPDSLKTTASSKNITIALISTNYTSDDLRWSKVMQKADIIHNTGDGTKYLNDKGEYVEIEIPEIESITEETVSNWGFAKQEDVDLPQINQTELVYTIQPNVFNVWGEVTSLDITLGEEQEGIVNEFLFQFTSGETPTTLILPDTIKWVNDAPEIEANMTYQCSIINNIGVICGAL